MQNDGLCCCCYGFRASMLHTFGAKVGFKGFGVSGLRV